MTMNNEESHFAVDEVKSWTQLKLYQLGFICFLFQILQLTSEKVENISS